MEQNHGALWAGPDTPQKNEARHHYNGEGLGSKLSSEPRQDTKASFKGKAQAPRTQVITKVQAATRLARTEYITPPEKVQALTAIRDDMPGNSGITQETRILEALTRWSLTTYEASRFLDSYDPRARVMSLRNKGHEILTSWTHIRTECGRLHRVGVYTLQRGRVHVSHSQHFASDSVSTSVSHIVPADQETTA